VGAAVNIERARNRTLGEKGLPARKVAAKARTTHGAAHSAGVQARGADSEPAKAIGGRTTGLARASAGHHLRTAFSTLPASDQPAYADANALIGGEPQERSIGASVSMDVPVSPKKLEWLAHPP
jgi:hypothetical protein